MGLRIVWFSNTAWCSSGYGVQGRYLLPELRDRGHDISVLAFWGLEGGMMKANGMKFYPKGADPYGNDIVQAVCQHAGADILITLIDAWVLQDFPSKAPHGRWLAWAPVDSEPVPGPVVDKLRNAYYVLPYSRHGEDEFRKAGLTNFYGESNIRYIPHGCFDYGARVTVQHGREEALGDIVNGIVDVDSVVGVDSTGNLCRAAILERHCLPLRDTHALQICTETGRSFVVTRDNEIMTRDGWVRAGDLTTAQYTAIMGVTNGIGGDDALRCAVDSRGTSVVARQLRDRYHGRGHGALSGTYLVGDKAIRLQTNAPPSEPSCVSNKETLLQANPDAHGVSIPRGDDRWRGAHNNRQVSSEEEGGAKGGDRLRDSGSPIGHNESIRSVDRVALRPTEVDDSFAESGQDRLGMGFQASDFGLRDRGDAAGSVAVLGYQEASCRTGTSVLPIETQQADNRGARRRGMGAVQTSSCVERTQEATFERIVSITPVWVEQVYDLTTDTGNFIVSGVLVHNCSTAVYAPKYDKAQAKEALGFPRDCFLAGMVAANKGFPSRKCFDRQFEAFARFRQRHPDAYLYCHAEPTQVYGGMDLVAEAQSYGLPGGAIRFPDRFLNWLGLPDTWMARAYNAFDVLLSATGGEGFCLPIIESMACGVRVIGTDFTSMRELISHGRTGYKVRPATLWRTPLRSYQALPDIDDIVNALEWAYAQERGPSAECVEFAQPFEWRRVVDDYWQPLLQEIERRIDPCTRVQQPAAEQVEWQVQAEYPEYRGGNDSDVLVTEPVTSIR